MSHKTECIEANMLQKKISVSEYEKYIGSYSELGYEHVFLKAYKVSKDGKSYDLDTSISDNDCKKIWEIYTAFHKKEWEHLANAQIVAQYIYEHRIQCGRDGNAFDDYIKAEYLIRLVNYLNDKHSHVIKLRQDEEMEEIIDEVNNIYDSAYFKNMNNPSITSKECFYQAEREYCKEKEIDYFVYQLHHDYQKAHSLLKHKEIASLAQQIYQWRMATGKPGDEQGDWEEAEKQYPTWLIKNRIATICWNLSQNKQKDQDHYWGLACDVIEHLEERGIKYIGENPHETPIHNVILEVVQGNEAVQA